jgi:tetratricopeptide (TPR) repeat protein
MAHPMSKRVVLCLVLFASFSVWAHDPNENWVEVRSPHFTVLTDSNEKQGRHIADQFERVRSVFHALFPKANIDLASPIFVIAVRDKKGFQALEPEAYLAKGRLELAGLFIRAPDRNYVLMRLDVQGGEHPFATVYHEYTHLLMGKAGEWMPLWLNEGLAEFFQNTEIHDKNAQLGEPSADDILYLRQNRLLPLTTLLKVDANSPYYHEEQKGSVFYAESWALTHYLEMTDREAHTHRLSDYAALVNRDHDSVAAAQQVFGNLDQLQKTLESYVQRSSFKYFTLTTVTEVDDTAFKVRLLTLPEANAVRADLLAYNQRTKDARALLESVLRDDPTNVLAHETMGYLEFRENNLEAARKWYEQAVKLDSQSYLAHYYFASISMREGGSTHAAEAETSLRTAIKLNPNFAPAYDQLAVLYGMQHEKLAEAHMLNIQAVQLDPSNLGDRMNSASVLLESSRYDDAIAVLQNAISSAKTPQEMALVQNRIAEIQHFQTAREQAERANQEAAGNKPYDTVVEKLPASEKPGDAGPTPVNPPKLKYPVEKPHGPRHVADGVIRGVRCTAPAQLELKVEGAAKGFSLYSNNYFKIDFTAANYKPQGEIHPCTDLEGMKARVQYSESSSKSIDGQILSIELTK